MAESPLVEHRPNGATVKLLYWIMGAMFSVILIIGGYILNGMDSRLKENISEISSLKQNSYSRGERIAVLEARLAAFELRMERTEGKVDGLQSQRNR